MVNLIILLIILTLVRSEEEDSEIFTPNTEIKFVWEINRHGARAPATVIKG